MYIATKNDKFIKSYNNIKYICSDSSTMYVNVYIFEELTTGNAIIDITKWNGARHNTVKLLNVSKAEANNFVKEFKKNRYIKG